MGQAPKASQSITLIGKDITVYRESNVESVRVTINYPKESLGYNSDFFHFPHNVQVIYVPEGTELEFYTGEVEINLGL
jgi:hypothetical protein